MRKVLTNLKGDFKDYLSFLAKTININNKTKRDTYYYEIMGAFDIETTSTLIDGEKVGIMYEWTFGIGDYIIIGRTWEEFMQLYNLITDTFTLNENIRLVVLIHNLSFEYQFLRRRFKWYKVFANEVRKPIYAVTNEWIEFRCSYLLSGYSLDTLAKNLTKHNIRKLKGDLDYSLIRTPITPMTKEELQYCINDVEILLDYSEELIDRFKIVANIPYTKTGIVRNHVRQLCFEKYKKYRAFISTLTLSREVYNLAHRAFMGGFTHANLLKVGDIYENVGSFDIASSYPYSILSEKYPMSKGEKIDINSEKELIENAVEYGLIFDVKFYNIRSIVDYDNYISTSKCIVFENIINNNGRVLRADMVGLTITEQDYKIIRTMYDWDKMEIGTCYRFKMSYLPRPIIRGVLEFYNAKTKLKGVEGKEQEYMNNKEMLNSIYGMMVMDVVRQEIGYTDDWKVYFDLTPQDQIDRYNKSIRRFLFYLWGVYITAYSRVNLHRPMYYIGIRGDYLYSDTDSLKVTNYKQYLPYFDEINKEKDEKLKAMCKARNIDFSLTRPLTKNGVEKPIGYFEFEGEYQYFKTLGAKRYMYVKDDKLNITISGVNKNVATPIALQKYGSPLNVLKAFSNNMLFDEEMTGKLTHTYVDYKINGDVVDYQGKTCYCEELSSIYLEKTTYALSMTQQFIDLIKRRSYEILHN